MPAPANNRNAADGKLWRDAIRKALMMYEGQDVPRGTALSKIAQKIIAKALDGDNYAITEIGNRIDGKPPQSVELSGRINSARDLSDDQLTDIATGGSAGAAEPENGEQGAG